MNEIKIIRQLDDSDLVLLTDSQDTEGLRRDYPDYDSFFVKVEYGELTEIWGFVGIVPYLSKLITKLK